MIPRRTATAQTLLPAFVLLLLFAAVTAVRARDAFVLLSGGADPLANNYSQYLQARAVADFFRRTQPADAVWVFFGAGNVTGAPPVFGDVLRQVREPDGLVVDTWLPGALPGNRPARREVVLAALRDEILPAVRDGGTLFLYVGDHGSETGDDEPESVIDLWGVKRDPDSRRGWAEDRTQKLRVSDLRAALRAGLGRGRVVFCMTQCHSGGFHALGAPGAVRPPAGWFTTAPSWLAAAEDEAGAALAVAGFTATDAASLAAGCDPAPDPETWAGYERFHPESLLGVDLFTLAPAGERRASFFAAHAEATLRDETIDRPRATSEHYLELWAELIEERLATESRATPALRRQLEAYRRAVDTGKVAGRDSALAERRELFGRFTERLVRQLGDDGPALRRANRQALEDLIEDDEEGDADGPVAQAVSAEPVRPAPGRGERRRAWNETVRPAWKEAVEANRVEGLNGAARGFELELLVDEEENGRRYTVGRRAADDLAKEVFWRSGYHAPATLDEGRARQITRWGAERNWRIAGWARGLPEGPVRSAAEKVFPEISESEESADAMHGHHEDGRAGLTRGTAAARILFYRRVLAAWALLVAMDEKSALAEVARLTALERTPLPAGQR